MTSHWGTHLLLYSFAAASPSGSPVIWDLFLHQGESGQLGVGRHGLCQRMRFTWACPNCLRVQKDPVPLNGIRGDGSVASRKSQAAALGKSLALSWCNKGPLLMVAMVLQDRRFAPRSLSAIHARSMPYCHPMQGHVKFRQSWHVVAF